MSWQHGECVYQHVHRCAQSGLAWNDCLHADELHTTAAVAAAAKGTMVNWPVQLNTRLCINPSCEVRKTKFEGITGVVEWERGAEWMKRQRKRRDNRDYKNSIIALLSWD